MWTEARDVSAMQEALSGIIGAYERDFAKHPNLSEFPKISMIWKSIPSQLAKENKKFIYKVVMENTDMAISRKLEIIYLNGQPDGIRSIRRHLSTMTTYVIPRPLLSEAKKLTGINRPGIYYLISENDDNKIDQSIEGCISK